MMTRAKVFTAALLLVATTGVCAEPDLPDVPVHTGSLVRATLHAYVAGYGRIEAAPNDASNAAAGAFVSAPVAGVLADVLIVPGQQVGAGTLLVRLDQRTAVAAVHEVQAKLAFAEQTLARQRRLISIDGTSQQQLEQAIAQVDSARAALAAAQTRLDLHEIRAPVAATVLRILVRPGEAVSANTVLVELADLDRLVAGIDVPVDDIDALAVGQPALMYPSGSTAVIGGEVHYIGGRVDANSGTVQVLIAIPADARLRPGRFVRARIMSETHADVLIAPASSIVHAAAGQPSVLLIQDGRVVRRLVEPGLRDGELVEITGSGLHSGMVVITEGAYGLPDGAKVRVVSD